MATTGKTLYKGIEAFFIESGNFRAIITERGSKMVSLVDKTSGRELLLQPSGDMLLQGTYDSDYNAVDIGGFDEMLPTIDSCFCAQYPWEDVKLPDHGEVWSIDWRLASDKNALYSHTFGVRLPYKFSKRIYFENESSLRIEYSLENLSTFDIDFIWAAHAMFTMEENSSVILPDGSRTGILMSSYDNILGKYGDNIPLNDMHEFHKETLGMTSSHSKYMDKFYINEQLSSGQCGVFHPSDNGCYMMTFPRESVPYLGILLSRGLHLGDCCILEPCTSAFDRPDLAKIHGRNSTLKARGVYSWHLSFSRAEVHD